VFDSRRGLFPRGMKHSAQVKIGGAIPPFDGSSSSLSLSLGGRQKQADGSVLTYERCHVKVVRCIDVMQQTNCG
jgi:hypothetical protein